MLLAARRSHASNRETYAELSFGIGVTFPGSGPVRVIPSGEGRTVVCGGKITCDSSL